MGNPAPLVCPHYCPPEGLKEILLETAGNWQLLTERLDGRFAYIPSPEGLSNLRVWPVRDACELPDPKPDAADSPMSFVGGGVGSGGGAGVSAVLAAALAAERGSPANALNLAADPGDPVADAVAVTRHKDRGIKGAAALVVPQHDGRLGCSYPVLLRKLVAAGAAAAIIGSYAGEDVTEMHCECASTARIAIAL